MDSKGADQDAKVTHRESPLGAQGVPKINKMCTFLHIFAHFVHIRFGTLASAPGTSFSGIITKRYHPLLRAGALRRAISMIFYVFVESGKQHLDCACVVGLGFEPLVFIRWAYSCAICFFDVCLTTWGVTH